jgi:serine/threonine protein kinase
VYEVFSAERMCSCVAKVVRPDQLGVTRIADRLLSEGRILAALAHPNLVRVLDVRTDPQPVVVLQTLPGPRLDHVIHRRERQPSALDIAHFGVHLSSALFYLHGKGFLHLDVRPHNVIVDCGIAVLADLSLGRAPGLAPRGLGTREYLAPEQATGGPLTAASDVWGLGATLYELGAGTPPFAALDDGDRRLWAEGEYLQLHRPAPPLSHYRRRLPDALTGITENCLRSDPAARPSIVEVSAVLTALTSTPEV